MPTLMIVGPYRLFFWSYDCSEPRHVHVSRDRLEAKFWLDPILLADNNGFRSKELRDIERIINDNADILRSRWDEYCSRA
ncbi:DUF4160 domain-containing protein [Candidatus Amarolinea aalborgensis]|uniref:DUF4160 domain-containing protein n=1 Tax=Candidatus Amarolinea aalborgensis TaxID=2249329 RepID=UPI003BF984FD